MQRNSFLWVNVIIPLKGPLCGAQSVEPPDWFTEVSSILSDQNNLHKLWQLGLKFRKYLLLKMTQVLLEIFSYKTCQ